MVFCVLLSIENPRYEAFWDDLSFVFLLSQPGFWLLKGNEDLALDHVALDSHQSVYLQDPAKVPEDSNSLRSFLFFLMLLK